MIITFPGGDAIAFGVEQATDLREIAIALDNILDAGRLHEVSIVSLQHSLLACLIAGHEDVRSRLHKVVHSLEGGDVRVLEEGLGRATRQAAVLDGRLAGQLFGRLNRVDHLLDGEEGGQVGSVRTDHDQCEEIPQPCDGPRGHCSRRDNIIRRL